MKLEREKSPREVEVEAGVWERIRGRPEASVIYTCLSAKDTPLTVNHAAACKKKKKKKQALEPLRSFTKPHAAAAAVAAATFNNIGSNF